MQDQINLKFLRNFLERYALIIILSAAFIVRISCIGYGLPLHVVGDEEVNVYSALAMIREHTLVPVFHHDVFVPLLYEPPVTAFINVILFVPTIAIEYVTHGMPTLADLKLGFMSDPSIFFLVARAGEVAISICNIALVYAIAQRLFRRRAVSLAAALLLATSAIDMMLSVTARHWTLGIFFSLLAFAVALGVFTRVPEKWKYSVSGTILGFSFGTSYLVYFFPACIYLIWFFENDGNIKSLLTKSVQFAVPFAFISAVCLAVHPFPLQYQLFTPTSHDTVKSPLNFFAYYLDLLFYWETPLLLFSTFGAAVLYKKEKRIFTLLGASIITALLLMFAVLHNINRYISPLLPLLAIVAGYGLVEMYSLLKTRTSRIALLGSFSLYAALLVVGIISLAFRGDSREIARDWSLSHIPAGSSVIVHSEVIRLPQTLLAAEMQSTLASGSMRMSDAAILNGAIESHAFEQYRIASVSDSEASALINSAASATSTVYVIDDAWAPHLSNFDEILSKATLVAKISGESAITISPQIILGGEYEGSGKHILDLLYGAPATGPDVMIYTLNK